jgi:sulfhydrogenase subunit beta (sulfur reductase)
MQQYILKKEDFGKFVDLVSNNYDFFAPVKEDEKKVISRTKYELINDYRKINLSQNTMLPVKYFFFDKKETLFYYDSENVIDPKIKIKKRILFGLRKCDLNGIYHQDLVFLDENEDPFYKYRREQTTLIGFHCKEGDSYCFCNSFPLKDDIQDIMVFDKGNYYIFEVNTDKGKSVIDLVGELVSKTQNILTDEDRKTKNIKELKKTDIKDIFKNNIWKELSEKCLSCGACTNLCPNCHCFTILDESNLDLKTGERFRVPASCQLRSFTRVAGDHVFRESRVSRYKHRIYHQIQYFRERHGVIFCTGCGRCIRGCPTKIDWVEGINNTINNQN